MPTGATPEPLLGKPLIVTGHLVTFDPPGTEIPDGSLYIDRDGIIRAVQQRSASAPSGFDQAARIDAEGLIYPGLIDLHNHIAYNCLPLWIAPDRSTPWTSREQWPRDQDYKPSVSLQTKLFSKERGLNILSN